jgi:hypothetical protein
LHVPPAPLGAQVSSTIRQPRQTLPSRPQAPWSVPGRQIAPSQQPVQQLPLPQRPKEPPAAQSEPSAWLAQNGGGGGGGAACGAAQVLVFASQTSSPQQSLSLLQALPRARQQTSALLAPRAAHWLEQHWLSCVQLAPSPVQGFLQWPPEHCSPSQQSALVTQTWVAFWQAHLPPAPQDMKPQH